MAKTVNSTFRHVIQEGGPFYAYAIMQLVDRTQLTLSSESDFLVSGNSYTHSAGSGFPLGMALCKTVTLAIDNYDGRYDDYDFNGCRITLFTEVDGPNNTVARVQEGIFTAVDPVTPGEVIYITAYDDMYKLDVEYNARKCSFDTALSEICTYCGVQYDSTWGDYTDRQFPIAKTPQKITARELAAHIAAVSGGNAIILPNGKLTIKQWDFSALRKSQIISGGQFGDGQSSNVVSGGQLGDSTSNVIKPSTTTGTVKVLNEFTQTPTLGTDDVLINRVKVYYQQDDSSEEISYTYPDDAGSAVTDLYTDLLSMPGYTIELHNKIGNTYAVAHTMWSRLAGVPFRPFSGSFLPDPSVEFMDLVYIVDRKDRIYQSFITGLTFDYLGSSRFENTSPTVEKQKQTFTNLISYAADTTDRVIEGHTPYQVAMEGLMKAVVGASGFYKTTEVQQDGSVIYYFHDQATLGTSTNIIKVTSTAITISNDGGTTYVAGITYDGDAVLNSLATKYLSADRIQGGTLTLGGAGNIYGTMEVLDESGDAIVELDKVGLHMQYRGNYASYGFRGIVLENSTERAQIGLTNNNELEINNPTNSITVNIQQDLKVNRNLNVSGKGTVSQLKFTTVGNNSHTPYNRSTKVCIPTNINSAGAVQRWVEVYVRDGILCSD